MRVRVCACVRVRVRAGVRVTRGRVCACVRARVRVRVRVCASGRAHSGALHSRERMTRAVPSPAQQAHRMISDAYGSGGLQIGRPVVMMASADEGGAEGLSRRQNLVNLQPHASPIRDDAGAIR